MEIALLKIHAKGRARYVTGWSGYLPHIGSKAPCSVLSSAKKMTLAKGRTLLSYCSMTLGKGTLKCIFYNYLLLILHFRNLWMQNSGENTQREERKVSMPQERLLCVFSQFLSIYPIIFGVWRVYDSWVGFVCVGVPMPAHTLSITMRTDLVCSLGQVTGWPDICSINHDSFCVGKLLEERKI